MRGLLLLALGALAACSARRAPEAAPPEGARSAPGAVAAAPPAVSTPADTARPVPAEGRPPGSTAPPPPASAAPYPDEAALVARVARACFGTAEGARATPSPGGAYLLVARQEKPSALQPMPALDYALVVRASGAVTACEVGLPATADWADAETVEVRRVPGTVRAAGDEGPPAGSTSGGRADPNRYRVRARTGDRQEG